MKKNHFLFQLCLVVLCCFMCSTTLYAKDGKIKYCNYIIYEGGIESKQPKGIGKIVIYGKKSAVPAVLIEGTFDGNTIINPRVEISVDFEDQFFNDEFKIDGKILINLNKESKYESFDLIFDDAIIYPSDPGFLIQVSKYESEYVSSIKVQNLVLSFLLGEKDFEQVNHVSDAVAVAAAVTAAVGKVNEHTRYWRLKAITQDFKYHFPFPNNERHSANVFHGEIVGSLKGPEQMKKLGYNPTHCYGRFVFANRISSIGNPFYVLAGNLVSDGSVFINEETNFKVTDNDWEGNRVFSDGTNIKKSLGKLECEVIFSDGGKFSGTLKSVEPYGNLYPVAASSTIDKNVFYSGEYTKDGKTERWIKGESQSALHQRIVSLYDEDLVAQIESGSISENDAAQTQRDRNRQRNEAKFGTPEEANTQITNQTYVHLITDAGIPHRNYEGKIIVSSFEEIVKLLNNDVVGYYDILAKDKQLYLPRLQKEKKYLMEDEFQREIPYNSGDNTDSDIWWPKYDLSKHCFTFRMWHHDAERYALSNEKGAFHLLVGCREANYCFTYPKSLVSVVNEKHRDGNRIQMQQDQTVYTCTVPDGEATIFSYNKNGSFLWQFKIEKVQANKKRIYGKTTKLQVVSGGRVLADISRTLTEKGNKFNQTDTKEYSVSPPKWHVCSTCHGKGIVTSWVNGSTRRCPDCGGKGRVYY